MLRWCKILTLPRVAGSDTTAIEMGSILNQLIRNPVAYQKLMAEIDTAVADRTISFPTKYAEATKLQYLGACCREGMRLHPALGLHLPRYVPAGGREIAGRFFAAGYRVGVNAAVLHYNRDIFGADADKFSPERWFSPKAANMEVRFSIFDGIGC